VVVLLALGLVLILLALIPGVRRPLVLMALVSIVAALVARSLTANAFLVAAAGILPLLVGLVAREMATTLDLVSEPRRELRRARQLEQREQQRAREALERERRRRERRRAA
jgi:hypothetical protein